MRQPSAGFVVVPGNRFFRKIPAGHNQRALDIAQQDMVQRRVGQHDAEIVVVGRNVAGDGRLVPPAQEDDGALLA